MCKPVRLVVLISGGGTTLQNLIDRIADGSLDAQILCVVSSRSDAFGLERARRAGIPTRVVERRRFRGDEPEFSRRINEILAEFDPDLVVLAGFLSKVRLDPRWKWRAMNIHPALLPSFGGKGYWGRRVHEAVLASGVRFSGCTVHFVDEEYDHGPIILQAVVPVEQDDTPETLAARVFEKECEIYPEAIRLFAQGRLKVEEHGGGARVRILPPPGGGKE